MLLTTRSFKTFNFKKTWSAKWIAVVRGVYYSRDFQAIFFKIFPNSLSLIADCLWFLTLCFTGAAGPMVRRCFLGHVGSQNIIRPPQTGWLDILITGNGLEIMTESISRGFPVLEATGNDLMDLMLFRTTFWPSWQSLTSPKSGRLFRPPPFWPAARYLADHCAVARFTGSAYEKISERYQAALGWDFWRAGCHLEGAFFSWRRQHFDGGKNWGSQVAPTYMHKPIYWKTGMDFFSI